MGYANDVVKNVDGTITKVNINREVVTIRGIIPGEYIINAHHYSTRQAEAALSTLSGERRGDSEIISAVRHGEGKPNKNRKLTVKIELHKVNPYTILWVGEKPFDHRGQEETFVRFTVDQQGNLIGGYSHEEKKFVLPQFGAGHGSGTAPNSFESEDGDRVQDSGVNGDRDPAEREFP